MRGIGLVLAAVAFSLTFAPAEAARQNAQSSATRSTATRPAATTTTRATPAVARSGATAPRTGIVRTAYASPTGRGATSSRSTTSAAPRNGRQSAAAATCTRASSSRSRGPQRCSPSGSSGRLAWQAGLTPAAGVQTSECPEGTMATLATGHQNVTRCMPL